MEKNGRIKDYELYISEEDFDWGEPVSTGSFENTSSPQTIEFPEGVIGKYFRLLALSEVNGNAWASAAEFTMVGCTDITFGTEQENVNNEIKGFPVPTNGELSIPLPAFTNYKYHLYNSEGRQCAQGEIAVGTASAHLDLSHLSTGAYFMKLNDERGVVYNVKFIKE